MEKNFRGIFAALTTPFLNDEVSFEKFKQNIEKYNLFPLSGYVVAGTSGEEVFLSEEEVEGLTRVAKENSPLEKKIIVGVAKESTRATFVQAKQIANLGADALLIRTPSYFRTKMTREALEKHYLFIADNSNIPIIIYHIPQHTGLSLEPELIIRLSEHPNIWGIKDSSGSLSLLEETIPYLPRDFYFLLGAASLLLPGLILGASGGILRLATILPGPCLKLYNLIQEGKIEEAKKIQLALNPVNKAITQTFGIAGTKFALDLLGFYGGLPRLPLTPLSDEQKKEMEKTLHSFLKRDEPL